MVFDLFVRVYCVLANKMEYFRAKPVNIPKITILLDNGYHPEKLMD